MAFNQQLQATFHIATLLLITMMSLAAAQSLQLDYRRRLQSGTNFQPGDNRIVLQCKRNTNIISNPQIWVERSDLSRQPVRIVDINQDGEVTIVITQDIEGLYSCSDNGDRSTNTLKLVGKESCPQICKLIIISRIVMILSPSFLFPFCSLPSSKSLDSFILCLSSRVASHYQLSCKAWKTEPILQCYVVEWQCDHCQIKPPFCVTRIPAP